MRLPPVFILHNEEDTKNWERFKNNTELGLDIRKFLAYSPETYKLSDTDTTLLKNADWDIQEELKVSCRTLSHYALWKHMVEHDIRECIICEEDIVFMKDFVSHFHQMAPSDHFDLLFLYNSLGTATRRHLYNPRTGPSCRLRPVPKGATVLIDKVMWLGEQRKCYYITLTAAKILVDIVSKTGFTREVGWFLLEQFSNMRIGSSWHTLVHPIDPASVNADPTRRDEH